MTVQSMNCPRCGKPATEYDKNKWQCLNCQTKFIYEPPKDPDVVIRHEVDVDDKTIYYNCKSCGMRYSNLTNPSQRCIKCGAIECPDCFKKYKNICLKCRNKTLANVSGIIIAVVVGWILLIAFVSNLDTDKTSDEKSDIASTSDSANNQPISKQSVEKSPSSTTTVDSKPKTLKRSAPTPDIEVDIDEFYDEFTKNRIAFDKKYNGKMIGITGKVGQVSDDSPAPSILLKCGTNMLFQTLLMPCCLQTSETALAEQLEDGDQVRIVGRYNVAAETLFWGDRPQLDGCVIAEMPQKDLNAASIDDTSNLGTLASPLTLRQLLNEIDNNEVRAMKKYKGQRIIIKVKWDSVDETMDGAPILNVMDFSILSMADCTLRMNQRDAVANIDLDSEILISAVFEGGSRNWGLTFTDGILNPREDVRPQVSQQTQTISTDTSQTQTSSNKEINVQQNAYSSIESDIETPSSQQNIYLDADDKIISDYLSENLPDYRLLNANDYDLGYESDTSPWRTKADFDGNGHQDYAFIAARKSNNKLAVIILNKYASGYDMTHTFLDDDIVIETEGLSNLGVFAEEPGPIICSAGDDEYKGPQVQIGMAKYPYIMAGVVGTDYIWGEYWWENGGYRSEAEAYRSYAQTDQSQLAIVNVQDVLNRRKDPSTDANVVTKLVAGAEVIENEGWVYGNHCEYESKDSSNLKNDHKGTNLNSTDDSHGFVIQLVALSGPDRSTNAEALRQKMKSVTGLEVEVIPSEDDLNYRVIIKGYENRESAEKALEEVRKITGYTDAFVRAR